jgi:hypothetical protein
MTSPDTYDDPTQEPRERVARALFIARGFRAAAWDSDTSSVNGLRRDCRYLAEAAITAYEAQS